MLCCRQIHDGDQGDDFVTAVTSHHDISSSSEREADYYPGQCVEQAASRYHEGTGATASPLFTVGMNDVQARWLRLQCAHCARYSLLSSMTCAYA